MPELGADGVRELLLVIQLELDTSRDAPMSAQDLLRLLRMVDVLVSNSSSGMASAAANSDVALPSWHLKVVDYEGVSYLQDRSSGKVRCGVCARVPSTS